MYVKLRMNAKQLPRSWERFIWEMLGGRSGIFVPRNFGKLSNLTNMFQMCWNHQPETDATWYNWSKWKVWLVHVQPSKNLNGFGQVLRRREKKSVWLNAWFPILGWDFEFSTPTGGNVEISMFHNFVGFSTNGYFLGSCRNLRRHVKGVWSFAPQDCIKAYAWSVVEENWCTDTTFFFVDTVVGIQIVVL